MRKTLHSSSFIPTDVVSRVLIQNLHFLTETLFNSTENHQINSILSKMY